MFFPKICQNVTSLTSLCKLDCWLTICCQGRWGNRKFIITCLCTSRTRFWPLVTTQVTFFCKSKDIFRVGLEVALVFRLCFLPFMWNFKALSSMPSMSITLLQTQHIALCLSLLTLTQLNFSSLNLWLNMHFPIANLNSKQMLPIYSQIITLPLNTIAYGLQPHLRSLKFRRRFKFCFLYAFTFYADIFDSHLPLLKVVSGKFSLAKSFHLF